MAAAATDVHRLQSVMSAQINYDQYGRQGNSQPSQQHTGGHVSAQYMQAGPSNQNTEGGHRDTMQPPAGISTQQAGSSSDRYQPSRGAQRDAKWRARNAERVAHLAAQQAAAPFPQWRQQGPSHHYLAPPQQAPRHHQQQQHASRPGEMPPGPAGPSTHYAMHQRGQTQYERPQPPLLAGLPVGGYTKERSGTHEREGRNEMYHRDEREHQRQEVAALYRMQRQTSGPVPQPQPSRSLTSDQITRSPPQQQQHQHQQQQRPVYASAAMAARFGGQQPQIASREAPKPPTGTQALPHQVRQPMVQQPIRMTPEQMRKQQMATIAAARQAHIAATRKTAAEAETERKIRRIQLQVFVHARPTYCGWKGCRAVLNSWALLEKHVLHCHLHPSMTAEAAGSSTTTPVAQLFELDADAEQEAEKAVRRKRVRYQSPEPVRIPCGWTGCSSVFDTREAAYQHVLLGHMGEFSARCPFNCLYEGAKFSELMAHIGRRHPTATPEHFVPGLIHHKPTGLPPKESLPRLPSHAALGATAPSAGEKSHTDATPRASGCAMSEIGARTKRLVMRRCFAGARPKKEDYVEKAGAGAGIRAVIENARRLSAAVPPRTATGTDTSASPDSAAAAAAEGQQSARRPLRATRLTISSASSDVSSPTSKSPKTALVDVRTSVREAKRSARQELRDLGGNSTVYQLSSSSESSSSSSDEEADTEASAPVPSAAKDDHEHTQADGATPRLGVTLLSDTEDESSRSRESTASDDASDTSEFRIRLKLPVGDRTGSEDAVDGPESHVTRGQRLKRKADELEEVSAPSPAPTPIKMKMWR